MIPIAIDDIIQATVEGTNERTPWAWVSHFRVLAVTDPATWLTDAAGNLIDVLNGLDGLLNTQWQADCVKFSRVAPQPMGVHYDATNFPVVGDVATDGVPPTTAVVCRFLTDEVGPWNRGRMYLTGLPEASTNGGQLSATIGDSIAACFSPWLAGFSSAGNSGVPVVFSRTLYGTDPPGHPANPNDYTSIITSVDVQQNLGTIRNRRYPTNASA